MDINIICSYDPNPEMYVNNFKPAEADFYHAEKLLRSKGKWVLARFHHNYRKSENYIKDTINTIAIDVDEGLSIAEFKEIAKDYKYAIGTTKSHQKPKNGKVCDRYRVIFPLLTYFNLSAYEFSLMMDEVNRFFGSDPACRDISRQFRGYPYGIVYIHKEGELLDWEKFLEKADKRTQVKQYCREIKAKDFVIDGDEDKFFSYAYRKFERTYYEGNRNNAVAHILLWGNSEGIDYEKLTQNLENWVNSSNFPLPQRELNALFKYHSKRR